jgi:hypothetical protein
VKTGYVRELLAILMGLGSVLLLCGAAPPPGGVPSEADAGEKEWEPPVARVPTMLVGEVLSVNVEEGTFRMMTRPRRRRPPGEVVVAVNPDTEMTRNQMLPMDRLIAGDRVRVHGDRPAPPGLPLYAEGIVEGITPVVLAVSDKVKVTIDQDAEVQVVRLTELRLEDLYRGMEVQALAWQGDEPLVARELQSYEVLSGAAPVRQEEPGEGDERDPGAMAPDEVEDLRSERSEP